MPFPWSTPASVSAIVAAILSNDTPSSEARVGVPGAETKGSRSDHVHTRLSATATGNLDGAGGASVIFTRTFAAKPAVVTTSVEDTTGPVVRFKVRSWLRADGSAWASGSPYGGCVIYGDRARPLPSSTPVSGGILLLVNLISALNNILGPLSGYAPFEPAAGTEFSLVAVQAS